MGSLPTTAPLLDAAPQPTASVQNLRPSHQINFIASEVPPPLGLYVTTLDRLHVKLCAIAGVPNTIFLEVRIMLPDGSVVTQEEVLTGVTLNTQVNYSFPLPEGFIISVSLTTTFLSAIRGTVYGVIDLQRGGASSTSYFYKIVSGYLSNMNALQWPNPAPDPPALGKGFLGLFPITVAAGADLLVNTPAFTRVRILSIDAKLTTSATVATRQVTMLFGSFNHLRVFMPSSQAASLVQYYEGGPGMPFQSVQGGIVTFPVPVDFWLPAGSVLMSSSTANLQAGDQWIGNIMGESAIDA